MCARTGSVTAPANDLTTFNGRASQAYLLAGRETSLNGAQRAAVHGLFLTLNLSGFYHEAPSAA